MLGQAGESTRVIPAGAPAGRGATRWATAAALLVLLGAAMAMRYHLASTFPYIHDEENTSIPLARTISFDRERRNLPIRAINHPALPAYFVKIGSEAFGTTPLGYRSAHVLVSLCTVAAVFLMTQRWYGPVAGLWAAALLAFNEYFLAISSRATSHGPYLFFAAMALCAFAAFLHSERARYLYASAVAVGLAFYCKEHSALLLPVFLAVMLGRRYRRWLGRPHPYLACAAFVLIIAPDVFWNFRSDRAAERVPFRKENVTYATYRSHLKRIGGVGVSPYPAMFYARGPIRSAHLMATGEELDDNTPEYHSMNAAIGVLLLGAVALTTVRGRGDGLRRLMLCVFWGVFGFFTLIRRGDSPGLDPVSWIWADVTMLAAVVLAGARLADARGLWRVGGWAFAAGALVYACIGIAA